jgi:hypothetical protein
MLWFNQAAYIYDAQNDSTGDMVWAQSGNTDSFDLTIASDLSAATVAAPQLSVERCDASGTCETVTVSVGARFDGVGPQLRSRQNSVSSVSRQSRFIAHGKGTYRFASATVNVDGDVFRPSTDNSVAIIYDTQDSYMEATFVPYGTSAPAYANVVPYDTSAPGEGVQAGQGVAASWTREGDGIFVNTFVSGSSRRLLGTGTVANQTLAFVDEQVYTLDEWGNSVMLSETFSTEGAGADGITVDNALRTGTFRGGTIPAVTCTYIDGEPICADTTVSASIDFTGYGKTTTTRDGNRAGVAGYWMWVYRSSSTTRQATAIGTVDGMDPGTVDHAQIDLFKQGYRTVTIQ